MPRFTGSADVDHALRADRAGRDLGLGGTRWWLGAGGDVGRDATGMDGGHADRGPGQLVSQGVGKPLYAKLGGRVRGLSGRCNNPENAGNIDDMRLITR